MSSMKWLTPLAFFLLGNFSSFTQSLDPVITKYSKIHDGTKYIISETVFADGHLENYISSVPVDKLRHLKSNSSIVLNTKNIHWDEDLKTAGLQISYKDVSAVEGAFNNALTNTEKELGYAENTLGRISLKENFLEKGEEIQSFILINKVIDALAQSVDFKALINIEGVAKSITESSKTEAQNILQTGINYKENTDKEFSYKDVEFGDHSQNTAIFLTNSDIDIAMPHVQAVYNWMFADQYTGWYNRTLLFNSQKNNSAKGLNDDFNITGANGYLGLGVAYGKVVQHIVVNPTFSKASAVCLQLVDPRSDSRYAFELLFEINKMNVLNHTVLATGE